MNHIQVLSHQGIEHGGRWVPRMFALARSDVLLASGLITGPLIGFMTPECVEGLEEPGDCLRCGDLP